MASAKEVEKELKIALNEIGTISPWFDEKFGEWIFSHKLYPVECAGATSREVEQKFPLYLKEFITHRLCDNVSDVTEKATKGKGGARVGSGRPKGTTKEPKIRVYLPVDMAKWVTAHTELVRQLMQSALKASALSHF